MLHFLHTVAAFDEINRGQVRAKVHGWSSALQTDTKDTHWVSSLNDALELVFI